VSDTDFTQGRPGLWRKAAALVGSLAMILTVVQNVVSPGASAATFPLKIAVVSARTEPHALGGAGVTINDPIAEFKYIINVDNTGETTQRTPADGCSPAGGVNYPASCKWTSVSTKSSSPIFTQGDETDFAAGINLPDGRYLISVLADGFKLDGIHFTTPITSAAPLRIELQPTPLPTATIKAQIFEDISPTNGAPDLPAEHGLAGFRGQIADYLGQVITDVFGNPMCTDYLRGGGQTPASFSENYDPADIGHTTPLRPLAHDRFLALPIDLDLDNLPMPIVGSGGECVSDFYGVLTIPNLGPNRYTLQAISPAGQVWIQTTTLEGNHDWDAWVMEGSTGLDTEFVQGGEPFPGIVFGFVKTTNTLPAAGGGHIKGVVDGVHVYVPATGGATQTTGQIFGGLGGTKIDHAIANPWLALTDLTNGDTAVWIGQGNANGSFDIPHVPDGNYTLTWWDEPQNYILDLQQITVRNGETVDMGVVPINGWWTFIDGYVFTDTNRNGVKDTGEAGVPNYALTMRKRENSLMDRGTTAVITDPTGYYKFESAYPMTQWLVIEAYNDRFYTTGATFQADNQPTPTTIKADRDANGKFIGTGVDVSTLPIIGLSGRLDWGVHSYAPGVTNGIDPQNGGIVGTVSYDTTRNELNPQYAAVEDWQPGVSGVNVRLYEPAKCLGGDTRCDAGRRYKLDENGAYTKGQHLNTYVTETWEQPTGCVARNVDGAALNYPADHHVLPDYPALAATPGDPVHGQEPCLEGPLMGVQFQNGFSAVDGNYGFTDGCFSPNVLDDVVDLANPANPASPANPVCRVAAVVSGQPLPAEAANAVLLGGKDYLVDVEIPKDSLGRDMYKVTREEDINVGEGDDFIPQAPPPSCAGPLHYVDVTGTENPADSGGTGYGPTTLANGVTIPKSTPTVNAVFPAGGSPYEGQAKPLCSTKLVGLNQGRSIVPTFNVFTPVPIPGRFWGLVVDDLNFSGDPQSLLYGEKAGVPFAPVGIYDYTNKLVHTTESDYNGLFDVLMPSTNRINCPTPSGVCANLYRFVGNDPGVPGNLNLNYHPEFRTIAAEFEALPGLIVPADLAPSQVGVSVQLPGGQTNRVKCAQDGATPQLFAMDKVHGAAGDTFTITGLGFGAAAGQVKLDNVPVGPAAGDTWADRQIKFSVPATTPAGPHPLSITASNGQSTVDGITLHVIGAGYTPNIYEVGPGKTYAPVNSLPDVADHAIQNALDAAAASAGDDLVIVYPGLEDPVNLRNNPRGAYYENLIVTTGVKLQGTGPGGIYPDNTTARGSIIDGSAFGGDGPVAADWLTRISAMNWQGNQNVNDGAVISIYTRNLRFGSGLSAASIDGFDLRGGNQTGFPNNINTIGGTPTGLPAGVVTQGGAIFANAYAKNLHITNNVVQNNGGAYGTIRIGTPDLPGAGNSNNQGIVIANNRIIHNAGTNLAGGIGMFSGSDGFDIVGNDICGNFSAEYGGGITVYGRTTGGAFDPAVVGKIRNNRIYFNKSYDEGGGVMIAGTLPANPALLSPGSGAMDITGNLIQANLSNDDGGGLRFLMAGNYPMNVVNNMIVNNVSTHEGGGIALNDTPDVRIVNNTIMKNLTTATALTSDGMPAPAGLSSAQNSDQLNASLAALGSPFAADSFSNPVNFNNIFWDNRAGTRAGDKVTGLGIASDVLPIYNWDLGLADGSGMLSPTNTVLQTTTGTLAADSNTVGVDPNVVGAYDASVTFNVWRNNPAFVGATLVAVELPPNLMGDYHILPGSPAINQGTALKGAISAPSVDFDGQGRPAIGGFDSGADEIEETQVDLAITKSDGRTTVHPTDTVTYSVVVTNNGPGNVTNAVVSDNPPASLGSVTWTCSATTGSACGSVSGTTSISSTVTLLAGGSATYTVSAVVNASAFGTVANTATVTAPLGLTDAISGNNSATDTDTVTPLADLSITKTDGIAQNSPTGPYPLDTITYTIVASNAGPNAALGATVTDTVPAALENVTWTCTGTGGGTCPASSGTGSLAGVLVNLPVSSTVTFTLKGRIVASATGSLVNTASIAPPVGTDDVNTANNSATDTDTIIPKADLSITKNDGVTTIAPGQTNQYTIVVSNAGPSAVTNATVIDTFPATFTGVTWTCTATSSSSCAAASGSGVLNTTVNLLATGSATYIVTGTVSAVAPSTLLNTVTVTPPAGTFDPTLPNTALDTDLVRNPTIPTVPLRDSFDRDGPALGGNWSVTGTNTRIIGDAVQGFTNSKIMWNAAPSTSSTFGAKQAAAFTYRNAPVNNTGLVLKASGGTLAVPATYVSVTYNIGAVTVSTVTSSGAPVVQGLPKPVTLANGDRLTALADGLGNVFLFRTTGGGTTTYIGVVAIPIVGASAWAPATGGGRIGLQVPVGQRVDDFRAGTIV
jgi:uncharacterized repeat protein (TIGR01451 family)